MLALTIVLMVEQHELMSKSLLWPRLSAELRQTWLCTMFTMYNGKRYLLRSRWDAEGWPPAVRNQSDHMPDVFKKRSGV